MLLFISFQEGYHDIDFLFHVSSCMITSGERKRVTITVRDKCGSGHLPCRDGTCLPGMAFCDGKRDCSDGSDECNEYCASKP